jgi:hypothetical protein
VCPFATVCSAFSCDMPHAAAVTSALFQNVPFATLLIIECHAWAFLVAHDSNTQNCRSEQGTTAQPTLSSWLGNHAAQTLAGRTRCMLGRTQPLLWYTNSRMQQTVRTHGIQLSLCSQQSSRAGTQAEVAANATNYMPTHVLCTSSDTLCIFVRHHNQGPITTCRLLTSPQNC